MSGQETPKFNIIVAPDPAGIRTAAQEVVRADAERLRGTLGRALERERRLHSTYYRIAREIAERASTYDILHAAGICHPALKSADHLQKIRDHIDRSSFLLNAHPLLFPGPSSQPKQEDTEPEPEPSKTKAQRPPPESQAEFRERMRDENPDYAY